jgi:hypothetical protein
MSDTSVANELRGLVDNATQQRRSYAGNTSEHTTTTRETKPLENNQTSSQNQAPTVSQQPENVLVVNRNNDERAVNIEEMTEEEYKEHELIHTVLPTEKKTEPVKKHNTGNVKNNFNDPDKGDPEKSKFDIQQGDIIEFMMKEIVLASAAWTGDKVCGYTGLWAYRTGSFLYRKGPKKLYDWGNNKYKNWRKEKEDARFKLMEQAAQTKPQANELEINDTDDKTTAFMKETLQRHQDYLADNKILEQREIIEKLAGMAIDGQLENRYFDNLSPSVNKALQQIAKNAQGLSSQENKDAAKEQVTDLIMDFAANEAALSTFASNYASARMMTQMAQNPAAFDNQDSNASYQALYNQGRIIMLMEMKKINYGKSSYKDINELISDSAQAHLHIKNQIQKGQYKEKDKEPLANEALDKLQNLWNKSKEQDRSKEEHTLLHEARVAEARMNRLNENLERTGRTVEAYNADREKIRERRRKIKLRTKDENANNSQNQTHTQTRGNDGR